MKHNINRAFDGIRAEDSLKDHTKIKLREKMQAKEKPKQHRYARQLRALTACLLLLAASNLFTLTLYYYEAAYVDLDINPSVELTVNRFDRVIGANAYNADGEEILSKLEIMHDRVEDALTKIIDATAQNGKLHQEGLVSVTLQASSANMQPLLENLEARVTQTTSNHGGVNVDVFAVDSATRAAALALQISPAKYLAILELQKVDPTATVEKCKDHSILEIKEWTKNHGEGHRCIDAADAEAENKNGDTGNENSSVHRGSNGMREAPQAKSHRKRRIGAAQGKCLCRRPPRGVPAPYRAPGFPGAFPPKVRQHMLCD